MLKGGVQPVCFFSAVNSIHINSPTHTFHSLPCGIGVLWVLRGCRMKLFSQWRIVYVYYELNGGGKHDAERGCFIFFRKFCGVQVTIITTFYCHNRKHFICCFVAGV